MPERALHNSAAFDEDLRYWIATDRRTALRIMDLRTAIRRAPFTGIGKPQPLKRMGPNTWSRRITDAHRLIYRVFEDRIEFVSARGHYD